MKIIKSSHLLYYTIPTILFLFQSVFAIAQKKKGNENIDINNSIEVCLGDFRTNSRSIKHFNPVAQIGLCYERRIITSLYIGVGYFQWEDWGHGLDGYAIMGPGKKVGDIDYRKDYKMIDLFGVYAIKITRNQFLYPKLGITYCWGTNSYISKLYVNPTPPYDEMSEVEIRRVHYLGIIPQITYDYFLITKKISIGVDLRVRNYFGKKEVQYDYGFHARFNF